MAFNLIIFKLVVSMDSNSVISSYSWWEKKTVAAKLWLDKCYEKYVQYNQRSNIGLLNSLATLPVKGRGGQLR